MLATVVTVDRIDQRIIVRVRRNANMHPLYEWDEELKVGQRIEVVRRINDPYLHLVKKIG